MKNRFWTFNTLVGAFVDLFIAYFLLCGSTVALFAVNFLGLFGLSLPSNGYGFVGMISFDYTSLLVDYPTDKVSGVRFSATRKFPFDSIFVSGCGGCDLEDDLSEGEGSCCSNWITCVDDEQSNDGGQEATSIPSDCNFSRYHEDDVLSDPKATQKRIPVNEADKDKMIVLLTRELEESKAARAALYVELEKERNASASAADEAMSMILRLQEEKAVVKMESRQYQRMIEEKSAYDAEEMNILKEIVLRREREKHFLEKQVEAYRQMISVENDRINGGNNQDFVHDPDLMLHQLSSSRLFEDIDFSEQEEPEKTIGEDKGLDITPGDAYRGGESGSHIYDVHVIDNEPKSREKSNGYMKQSDQEQNGSVTRVGLPPVSSKSSLRRYSTSALDNERTRLDSEVEWLRERLRNVEQGRVKLNFSVDNREKESLQMQLLEDIAGQLHEIRMLTEPRTACQASLPLPSSKEGLTKIKRCRSVSSVHAKSS
ncbi:putative GTD-binding domain-containing protein [Helianthus annuus]|uniref:GTD-binding domain-containing protein n=1 Tax=Helianthus annuus TaxID=4232 RepID=A0A251S9K5_HELAN|nr:myosin-binding protein 3 [Helianthus annuus]KAF5765490.1 putative GTD-binding domain-containing protein [Helianthus annuus]KAJ0452022.1 putative GTD-binding domain-containing protein [Helianthus annuus]KAJ0456754.1 putative GTD-binding domain-containing protein [Helianthus annuus]KAJ0473905.1 putative GTD-binding domain-containing protein [Helianthus annuus]KAJ0649480.1 putative GTD-binding domain-containing protein [Helianthus annuus]